MVLAVGGWSTNTNVLNIPYQKDSGRYFHKHRRAINEQDLGDRNGQGQSTGNVNVRKGLMPLKRIRYVPNYLLAKICHTPQVLPAPKTCKRQLSTAIAWYIWKETSFRVPMSSLQRPKRQGGWGLLDIEAKCQALLLGRLWIQSTREGSATATWLHTHGGHRENAPYVRRIPTKLTYLHC
jgi:hypothetical protein